MASIGLTRTLFVRSPWTSRVFLAPRPSPTLGNVRFGTTPASHDSAANTARHGVNELKKAGTQMKDQASSAAGNMAEKSKDAAGKATGAAQDIVEKAKQTAQDAWSTAKDTAQKVKETVAGKAEESADAIKENVNSAKRSMNSKN